ncbi:MAG: aminotransferase class V-fold PLP-dependent enzyme [Clostridia bacterium]|nr:aminotransferase class V-fold PLP-dependent enzyme [Clostridia bacterium]
MDYTLYNIIKALAEKGKKRFHMPGHKGHPLGTLLDGAYFIDYTETPDTGDLYGDDHDFINEAEERAARYFGAESCLFLTCGATQGIKSALYTFTNGKNSLLVDRNTHKSILDTCVLLDIMPKYIVPEFDGELGITKGFKLDELDRILAENSDISAFIITSPTYYGYCHDVKAVADVCHSHDVKLIVDSAHGSHLKACGAPDPVTDGADAVIFSAHKTLPSLTQGAYLLLRDGNYAEKARRGCIMFGTTSPSYPMMASLDIGREFIEKLDENTKNNVINACADVRRRLENMGFISPCLGDPLRITICCKGLGYELYDHFMAHGIVAEMADDNNVVMIVTFSDELADIALIADIAAYFSLENDKGHVIAGGMPMSEAVISPREAFFGDKIKMPLKNAVGMVAGENIYIYPPGVPIIALGEKIDEKSLEYLTEIRYNIDKEIAVVK